MAEDGYFLSYYDSKQGIIYNYASSSPKQYQRKHPQESFEPPIFKHWSDVNFIEWANQTKTPQNLELVCHLDVLNPDTWKIVCEAGQKKSVAGSEGTNATFSMEDEGGKAILGTPLGRSVARLLIDHKTPIQMGLKEVFQVRAFRIPKSKRRNFAYEPPWHLAFSIRDVKVLDKMN